MISLIKTLCLALVLFFNQLEAQNQNIETHSIATEDLITYIAENYNTTNAATYNFTFLIQTPKRGHRMQEKIVLKQAFNFLSKRLQGAHKCSLLTYSGLNGVALEQVDLKDSTIILDAVDHLKTLVKITKTDGIGLAYNFANTHYNENATNRVVIIRMPEDTTYQTTRTEANSSNTKKGVVLTAITILPELISILAK
jgi:hypothetical protein